MRMKVLGLYKVLMRETQKIPAYNFREYAKRRVRDTFKDNRDLKDTEAIKRQLEFGRQNVEIIKRQAIIGDMFKTDKLVIEK